jgi:hypothetical protein
MKVAIVVFVIGEQYVNTFNNFFKFNLENYCKKYNYDLIILNELIQKEDNIDKKKFFWQRLLIPFKYQEYDYVISLDSDIYINYNAPPLPLDEIPLGKVGAVNERKYLENYEWRENVQKKQKWNDTTGIEWYALSGDIKNYNDHINGGLVIYQPKYHAEIFKNLYVNNIKNYLKYHQDDQSILSSYLIDNNMIYWLDQRFNRVWFFWKEIMYPFFDICNEDLKQIMVLNYISLNFFCHFTGNIDVLYLKR